MNSRFGGFHEISHAPDSGIGGELLVYSYFGSGEGH